MIVILGNLVSRDVDSESAWALWRRSGASGDRSGFHYTTEATSARRTRARTSSFWCSRETFWGLWAKRVRLLIQIFRKFQQRFSIPVLAPPRSAYLACLSLLTHLIQIISSLEVRSVHELCSDWHAPYTGSIAPYTGSIAPYTGSIAPYTGVHCSLPEHVSGAERWEFPLPAHVGVRSPAPPLKVGPDRSAQFRSPLIYNSIPLRWNRSTLAQI